MADGLSGVGSMPFNIGSHIHEQTRAREAIETHFDRAKGRERA